MKIKLNKCFTMVYWRGEKFWLGKFLEFPEIMTQGETPEELEENLRGCVHSDGHVRNRDKPAPNRGVNSDAPKNGAPASSVIIRHKVSSSRDSIPSNLNAISPRCIGT